MAFLRCFDFKNIEKIKTQQKAQTKLKACSLNAGCCAARPGTQAAAQEHFGSK